MASFFQVPKPRKLCQVSGLNLGSHTFSVPFCASALRRKPPTQRAQSSNQGASVREGRATEVVTTHSCESCCAESSDEVCFHRLLPTFRARFRWGGSTACLRRPSLKAYPVRGAEPPTRASCDPFGAGVRRRGGPRVTVVYIGPSCDCEPQRFLSARQYTLPWERTEVADSILPRAVASHFLRQGLRDTEMPRAASFV